MAAKGLVYNDSLMERELGTRKGKVSAWKKGQIPNVEDLRKIAEVFGISCEWLLTGQGEPSSVTSLCEESAGYREKYFDERERFLQAREEVVNLREKLIVQHKTIIKSVTHALRAEDVSESIILRVHEVILDYGR